MNCQKLSCEAEGICRPSTEKQHAKLRKTLNGGNYNTDMLIHELS
jgi:hypothetical protein